MEYFIGTPPIKQTTSFDTGSDVIWLQCQPCVRCYRQISPIYDPKKSSSYKQVGCKQCHGNPLFFCISGTCQYQVEYLDNTTSKGLVFKDTLSLPDNVTLPNAVLGCGLDNFDPFAIGAGGIVGLQNTSTSLVGQLKVGQFSYCTSHTGGYIQFGSKSKLTGARTTLFSDDIDDYHLNVLGITVDTLKLNISSDVFKKEGDNTGVVIDSGTAYTYLTLVAYDALLEKIEDRLRVYSPSPPTEGWELCYNGDETGLKVASMPAVSFLLDQGTTIAMPNENVWTEKDEFGNICLKMFQSEDKLTTIGSQQLLDFNVGYDLTNKLLWLDHSPGCMV